MAKHIHVPKGENRGQAEESNDLGLTEAFAPIAEDFEAPTPKDEAEESNDLGLTEAFAPISSGAHAGKFKYQGDTDEEFPDVLESLEPVEGEPMLFEDKEEQPAGEVQGKHGKDVTPVKEEIPVHLRKSRRMRKVLIVVIILLVLLAGGLGYFTFRLFTESESLATQQTQAQQGAQDVAAVGQTDAKDASTVVTKKTEVPNLVTLLGMTQDEAVAKLAHGATVTSSREVNEEGSSIKTSVTVALTDEPSDTRSGTPTVYLGLNEEGKVVQSGYSAATASLGYGSLSFIDSVKNNHIVEKTLREAGIEVADGTVALPADKMAYSTYASDNTTLVKENCSFNGTVDVGGSSHAWSSVLLYDYTTANSSGNLADTIRKIYVYINA